jgi:DNA mismatch repair protein MutL
MPAVASSPERYASEAAPGAPPAPPDVVPQPGSCSHEKGLQVARQPEESDERITGHIRPLGQVRQSFVAATDEEGLLLIDQHAAHERILFERFRDALNAQTPVRQPLLVPETIDLTPAQAGAFDRLQPELEAAGFEVLTLSGRTIAITAVPAELPAPEVRTLLLEVLDAADGRGRASLESVREEIAASLACRAAIKINMPLSQEKMRWLIDELLKARNPWTCPHGRPAILRFTIRDIERQFQRP